MAPLAFRTVLALVLLFLYLPLAVMAVMAFYTWNALRGVRNGCRGCWIHGRWQLAGALAVQGVAHYGFDVAWLEDVRLHADTPSARSRSRLTPPRCHKPSPTQRR